MSLYVKCKRLTNNLNCKLMLMLCLIASTNTILAEGSKELSPGTSDRLFLYLNGEFYNSFGRYDGNADQRLFFHIANPDQEQVFLGFSQAVSSGHFPCRGVRNTSYFRIKDSDGNVVFPNRNDSFGQLLDANSANIASKNQAQVGPQPIGGNDGYTPFIFDPAGLPAGDYYVEFSTIANLATPSAITAIEHWDITVATKNATPTAIDGRVFAINWSFYAPSIECGTSVEYSWFDRPFNGRIYVLSKEGFVNLVDFKDAGFQPAAFNLYFNETGASSTGDLLTDRKSIVGLGENIAFQRIFLNDPDPNVYPSGEYGTLNDTPELHICETSTDGCFMVTPTKPGQIEVLIEFDAANSGFRYDPNTRDVLLVFNITPEQNEIAPYRRCIPWDGTDGLGNIVSTENDFDIQVTFQQGVYHLPVYDVEFLINGYKTTNIRPSPPSGIYVKPLHYDDTNIPFNPGNGADKVNLDGCVTPCHNWVNRDYGDRNTINSWFFADEEQQLNGEEPLCLIQANVDSTMTGFETPINIFVLNNDVGEIIDTNSINIINQSNYNGEINIELDGTITYFPADGFIGLDSFEYEICYDVIPRNSFCEAAYVYVNVGSETETDCKDGLDNDLDGFIDCNDSDCLPISPPLIRRNE